MEVKNRLQESVGFNMTYCEKADRLLALIYRSQPDNGRALYA